MKRPAKKQLSSSRRKIQEKLENANVVFKHFNIGSEIKGTVAIVYDLQKGLAALGGSFVHPGDPFIKKIGAAKSKGRAVQAFVESKHTDPILSKLLTEFSVRTLKDVYRIKKMIQISRVSKKRGKLDVSITLNPFLAGDIDECVEETQHILNTKNSVETQSA